MSHPNLTGPTTRDKNGDLYVKKAMIGCGLALNLNGQWEVQQLFPHFQEIVKKSEYDDSSND